jgi:DNA-binding GntR family transcriptional regulator
VAIHEVDEGRPETLMAYTMRRIKTGIADGKYGPGSRLSPNVLAAEYGISHIPVREALTSLAAQGYIVHKQSQGFFTRELSWADLADIYHWRQVLEREAYRIAVAKITDRDIAEMRRVLKLMGKHTNPRDRFKYLEPNREFHFIAFKRVGSDRLLRFLNYLWDIAAPYAAAELIDSTGRYKDHFEHIPLFEARDAEAVIAAMDEHREYRVRHIARGRRSTKTTVSAQTPKRRSGQR